MGCSSRDAAKPLAVTQAKANVNAGPHPATFAHAGFKQNLSLAPAH
jgi:hypothetical protein